MAMFEFRMIVDGVERVKQVEIPDEEMKSQIFEHNTTFADYRQQYRENVIRKHLEKWALSHLQISYEEVIK